MRLTQTEAEQIARAGAAALQAGRAVEAQESFERLVAAGQVNIQVWLLLGYASRAAGDMDRAGQAADEVLRLDNRNLRALIMKGDSRLATGDERGASSFYGAALKLAGDGAVPPPPDLAEELERARRTEEQLSVRYRAQLEQGLEARGIGAEARSDRFRESLALMFGEKEIFLQKPSAYYFPRLPQIQFYERSDFPWTEAVESAAGDILAELDAVLAEGSGFRPYLESRSDRPTYDFHGLLDNPDWSTLYLWENGAGVEANIARCPKTFAALQRAPLCRITTRAPSILFSLLKGGARIAPHHGMINTRLICHLPLIVPPGCGFRVGNEVREWEVGKLLIFDDTIEHEAWNDSDEDRVVLIFDVWRPELSDDERAAVTAMFSAIDDPA